jgi:hypothetical protein
MAPRRRTAEPPPSGPWPKLPIILAVAFVAILVSWLTVIFTFNLMGANASARSYAPLWIGNSVKAATASAYLEGGKPTSDNLVSARTLATAVLRREPANVVAARTLALVSSVAEGNDVKAKRLITYAESLSRRDLPTQLWLIEKNVAANKIDGALVHYDRALRTNVGARDILIPILSEAAKQPAVAAPLAKMLAKRPLWWTEFADKFIFASDAPEALALTMGALRLDAKKDGERNFLQQTMVSLVEGGAPAKAYSIYLSAVGNARPPSTFVRNGGFAEMPTLAPFDWLLLDEADLAATRDRRDEGAGDWSLFLTAQNGRNGIVARQLLMLPPGSYRLGAIGGDMPRDAASVPVVSLICADKAATMLGRFRYTAGRANAAIDGAFTVPSAKCPAVWLLVSRSAPLDRESVTPWVDGFAIRPS